jgi:hypothetical protein
MSEPSQVLRALYLRSYVASARSLTVLFTSSAVHKRSKILPAIIVLLSTVALGVLPLSIE